MLGPTHGREALAFWYPRPVRPGTSLPGHQLLRLARLPFATGVQQFSTAREGWERPNLPGLDDTFQTVY